MTALPFRNLDYVVLLCRDLAPVRRFCRGLLGFPADRRDYGIGMQILVDIGVKKMRLLTNNPAKRAGLEAYGLEVVERLPIESVPNPHNIRYLETKRKRMGHLLDGLETLAGGAS